MTKDECHPRLYLTDGEKQQAVDLLARHGIVSDDVVIGVAPGAVYGPAKRWPAERFASAIDSLGKDDRRRFVLFGSENERPIAEEVQEKTTVQCVNLAGDTSLRELIALMDRCDLFLTNDSGGMHIASALQIPIVAIFGSTNPLTTSPYGDGHILIRHPVHCSPCLKRECPTDFKCMLDISPEEVAEACEKQLTRAVPSSPPLSRGD